MDFGLGFRIWDWGIRLGLRISKRWVLDKTNFRAIYNTKMTFAAPFILQNPVSTLNQSNPFRSLTIANFAGSRLAVSGAEKYSKIRVVGEGSFGKVRLFMKQKLGWNYKFEVEFNITLQTHIAKSHLQKCVSKHAFRNSISKMWFEVAFPNRFLSLIG